MKALLETFVWEKVLFKKIQKALFDHFVVCIRH